MIKKSYDTENYKQKYNWKSSIRHNCDHLRTSETYELANQAKENKRKNKQIDNRRFIIFKQKILKIIDDYKILKLINPCFQTLFTKRIFKIGFSKDRIFKIY